MTGWLASIRQRNQEILPVENFACRTCGLCCRSFTVNLNHFDVYRLIDSTRFDPLIFLCVTEPDNPKEPEAFQYVRGTKNLSLQYKPGKEECLFLDPETDLCAVHPSRPGVCRTWPFDFNRNNEPNWIDTHIRFVKKNCAFTLESTLDMGKTNRDIEIYNLEQQLFVKLIEEWNNLFSSEHIKMFKSEATLEKFIQYLLEKRPEEESKLEQMII